MVVVQPPAAVEQRAVDQSSRSRYSTEEENALTLFAMESHDCLSALIFYLAHLVRQLAKVASIGDDVAFLI